MIGAGIISIPCVQTGPFRFGEAAPPRLGGLTDDWRNWFTTVSPQLKTFAPHHKTRGEWLQSLTAGVRPRPAIDIWPRGHGKSTFAEHGIAYLAERRKRHFALYICNTQDSAERHVQNVQNLLENIGGAVGTRKENQYGHSRGWKASMLRTASGFNIVALGLDVAMRGIKLEDFRPDLIVFDDIDGRHDSLHVIGKKKEILTDDIIPAGSDDVAIWGVQNLVAPNSLFSQLSDGRADFLADRHVNGPIKAVEGIQTEKEYRDDLERAIQVIKGGTPTWEVKDLKSCQKEIIAQGWSSFDREQQQNVKDVEGALWTTQELNETRLPTAPSFSRAVVGVDPATTSKNSSDETGIIACGRDARPHGYAIEDRSGHYKPDKWGRKAVMLHDKIGANCVVGEANQGGEMVESVIQTAAKALYEEGVRDSPNITVELVHASKGKRARAEPIAQFYSEDTIHHVGALDGLEAQMTTWDASDGSESPDRVDALVWALTELMLGQNKLPPSPTSRTGHRSRLY